MHIHLFEKFDLNLKSSITWRNGVLIGYRSRGSYYMALYRLNDFYVEIQYHTCFDGIASIETYKCDDEIQEYLQKIDITEFLP
jgi:hypothetical protein